jgi:hypothetical protein
MMWRIGLWTIVVVKFRRFSIDKGGLLIKYGTLTILKGKLDLAILSGGVLFQLLQVLLRLRLGFFLRGGCNRISAAREAVQTVVAQYRR